MEIRGSHADDMTNPITDACARDLAGRTPESELPFTVPYGVRWKEATPEYRDFFRERARRFLAGDMSVLPWTYAIGERRG